MSRNEIILNAVELNELPLSLITKCCVSGMGKKSYNYQHAK